MPLPNLSSPVAYFSQPMQITIVTKKTQGGDVIESYDTIQTRGVSTPFRPEELEFVEEGQRSWLWRKLHILPSIVLKIDDIIIINGLRFRVARQYPFNEYGFCRYDVQEDYQG